MRAKKRVRLHLVERNGEELPSVEGVLVGYDWTLREYRVAVAKLHWAAGAQPDELDNRELRVPRERVAFYEVVR